VQLLREIQKPIMKAIKNKFPTRFHLQKYYGSENTGVYRFEIWDNYIIVAYKDGRTYLYNDEFPGKVSVEIMQNKARKGDKLGSYINSQIRNNYVAQWDKVSKTFKRNKSISISV
jgi:hypothetical protein